MSIPVHFRGWPLSLPLFRDWNLSVTTNLSEIGLLAGLCHYRCSKTGLCHNQSVREWSLAHNQSSREWQSIFNNVHCHYQTFSESSLSLSVIQKMVFVVTSLSGNSLCHSTSRPGNGVCNTQSFREWTLSLAVFQRMVSVRASLSENGLSSVTTSLSETGLCQYKSILDMLETGLCRFTLQRLVSIAASIFLTLICKYQHSSLETTVFH